MPPLTFPVRGLLVSAWHAWSRWCIRLIPLLITLGVATDARAAKNGLEVLVVGDAITSPEGFRPKPGVPIHYIFAQTQMSLGESVAGIKMPDTAVIERYIVAELGKQGFIRTEIGGPLPALYIVAVIGDANFEEPPDEDLEFYIPMVNTRLYTTPEAVYAEAVRIRYRMSPRRLDNSKIEAITGVAKVIRGLNEGSTTNAAAERISWAIRENRLFVTLNAFDAERYAKKEHVLLWRTSMSIDWRNDLSVALPTMLAHAGPLFGTDTAAPTFVDNRDTRTGDVQIGEAVVVPENRTPAPKAAENK